MDLVKKTSLMLIVLIWTAELLTTTRCYELDECCYSYGSVPYNDSFCVPYGEQVDLSCVIINPHDNFTNLTVTWFRSTTEDMSRFEEIPATSGEYKFINYDSDRADDSLSMSNCSHDLYRDSFVLIIYHFTQDKNGHYRCQLSINNALVQPSHHTQFSAGDCNITNYYRLTSLTENQCVEYVVTDTDSMTTYKSAMTSSVTLSRESSRRSPSVTQQEKESDGAIVYVAGSLGALVIVFGALAIVLSILFICKFQNRETTSLKPYQRDDNSNTENQDDVTATTSLTDALASVQDIATRSTEDDIYSVVSDHSIDDLGLHTSCPDNQTPHALPYEVAVFQGQSLSDDTQALQYTTDSKAVLQPYDEVDHNKQNQQYRENQTFPHINDEHHMYDEVKHEAKVGQRKLIMSAVNDTRERESITASELFDDMVYEGRNVTLHAMCNTSMDGYDYAEPTATKKQRDQFRFAIHDEHLYDSVDQLRKGQMATLTTNSGDNDNINGEPDGTKHIYHSLETGTHGRVTNPESYNMPIGYQSTTLQDINSQSGDCDPTLYNCQFDDPMYESNPHPGGDLKVIATPSSMKADVTELQEDELTMQGNPELLINYSGDAENYCNTDTPQHTDLASESNTITMESQDKADRNLASIYDMFDDPTYGVCHTGSNKK